MNFCTQCGKKIGFFSTEFPTPDLGILCHHCYQAYSIKKFNEEQELKKLDEQKKAEEQEKKIKQKAEEKRKYPETIKNTIVLLKEKKIWDVIINYTKNNKDRLIDYFNDQDNKVVDYFNEKNWIIHSDDWKALKTLLNKKYKINVNNKILSGILRKTIKEIEKEEIKNGQELFKKEVLSKKFTKKEEYVHEFLQYFGENAQSNMNVLYKILKARGFEVTLESVAKLVKKRKQTFDLDSFEQKILHGELDENKLDSMDGYDFEHFLATLFEKMGYEVLETKLSGDQGADLIVSRFNIKTAVQAKHHYAAVGNKAIQEVVASKNYYNCDKTLVISNSSYTKSAVELAKKNRVELWDRKKLRDTMKKYNIYYVEDENKSNESEDNETEEDTRGEEISGTKDKPTCVICSSNRTDNPDGICDDCKYSIINNKGIPPNID